MPDCSLDAFQFSPTAKLAPVSWPSVQKSPAAPAPVEIASQQFLYV